ncbi:hypothetical protein NXF25_021767 [Crotalus adamanteus]|uniref:MAM domain-containing protein n=1 Tax=Crotalus adamanteus TaxID=8729 RepID=A0AAW1B9N7_CROAD
MLWVLVKPIKASGSRGHIALRPPESSLETPGKMGCEKAGLVLLLLTLEGLLATRAHSAPGVETPQKALSTDYYCDFDNADRPFCDWSAPPDSQWLRERGQRPGESPGPPEGDIARTCETKCDFDNPTDLCGWSNPEEGDVAWGQWSGPTNMPVGSFMLLDSFDVATRGSGFLKSPTFNSSGGCLRLTFRYTLHGVSNDTALKIYAAPPGKFLGFLKGTPPSPPKEPPSRHTLE